MIRFVLRRFLWAIPVLWVVATLTFLLMQMVPGGPFDKDKPLPPEIKANVEAKYHLDKPVWQQYLLYLRSLSGGDLGPSYKYLGRDVTDIIRDALPVSLQLGMFALGVAILAGFLLGILAVIKPYSWIDRSSMFMATAGISVPNFVIGALLILFLSHLYKFFPPALWEGWRYAVLPALTLGLGPAAFIARLLRSSILETLHQDFVRTARAKGMSEAVILVKHVLKNSVTPVVTFLGPLTATLVTGSFVVEYIFAIPGMGRFFITAVTNRDYPLIMGVTLVYAIIILLANLLVDLAYAYLDPRVRVE
jgi:oligopeptide transport system permease protein